MEEEEEGASEEQQHGQPGEDAECVFCCEELSKDNYAEYRPSEGK